MEGGSEGVGTGLDHVTNSKDSRVDLEGTDVLEEEAVELGGDKVDGGWIVRCRFEVGHKLKRFKVEGESSEIRKDFIRPGPITCKINFKLPLLIGSRIKLGDGSFSEGCEENISTIRTSADANALR